jgi:LmbE family N-acetylglucosaminyl deacetylase
MKILYIFPHPDDESFGPAAVINSQVRNGHEIHLLTLTKGGATKERHKLGLTVAEMGEVRFQEMVCVENVLNLSGMKVLDYPDGKLKELDPRILEREVEVGIERLEPDVVVTHPVHGVSGFHDHLVAHAVVKRVFTQLKEAGAEFLKRLAFVTLPDSGEPTWTADGWPRLKLTEEALIDCVVNLTAEDVEAMKNSLGCYASYKDVIEESGVIEKIGGQVYFEIYNEDFSPPLGDLTDELHS